LPFIEASFPEFFACLQGFVDNWLADHDLATRAVVQGKTQRMKE